jgi:hypothetical protein
MRNVCLPLALFVVVAIPAAAQQTGSISGRAVDADGLVLPGVTVDARSDVLPAPRVTTTGANGDYRLPALQPGSYTVSFELAGMQTVTREVEVQLAQDTLVNVTLGIAGLEEAITVVARSSLVDPNTATLGSGVSSEQIMALPTGQDYRDLLKLIPAVQYTEDQVRGPSAGGSGQDNVYQFDGVNVTWPLFGTLSAEPAAHDVSQVTTIRGGARAVDFDRSGGFTIDSVSKSGTNRYSGMFSYQFQNDGMVATLESGQESRFEQSRSWVTLNAGGPVITDRLFFYGSYYRPERSRGDRSNLYGPLPDFESTRNEGFGKLTLTPTNSMLLNFSYRHSQRDDTATIFDEDVSATTGTGEELRQRIATAEGSWIVSATSHVTFRATRYALETLGRPDFIADVSPSLAIGTRLAVANLDRIGRLTVPTPVTGQTAYNAFIQPLIDRYGFVRDGARVGGGIVGLGSQFNDQDFFRTAGQAGYNVTLGTQVRHDLHVGYQRYVDSEDLTRSSNGWGIVTVPGGRTSFQDTPIFYTARIQRQTAGQASPIVSEFHSQSIEINDTIRWNDWSFNLGVLMSNDTLYGQGLREDPSVLSGFVAAPGNKYRMYEIPFRKMIQPRLGATWTYDGENTVYASFAQYKPAASSLPRAASWDRNLIGTFIDAHFDADGVLFAAVPVGSSSGKLFAEDLTPRRTDEFILGTARQVNSAWSARLYGRYREGSHFWEDTNNNARIAFDPPPGIPRELYIPDLSARLEQIGSGSSYVIAELDGAYTKYYETTLESEWRGSQAFVRGSYTWSRYTGNFDQDNSTGVDNDMNTFIGSSNIADGAGRQLWDFKEGRLRGDRPHLLKLYGYRLLPWNASAGAFAVAQSGHPWQAESVEPYLHLTTSTVTSNRYAEPAGSRRTSAHWQLDLKYIQSFRLAGGSSVEITADLYNVFNNQTGYDPQPSLRSANFGVPRRYFEPRRFQLEARVQF